MLIINNLTKEYGQFKLNISNLVLKEGQLFGCLGENGSGKSTLVKLASGQIRPTSGNITVMGTNVVKDPVEARTKMGIIPEQESPPSFLTVSEYLQFICKVRKIDEKKITFWLDFFDYTAEKDTLIKDLSRGTKQKVVATQAFIHQPKIVFIDEPLINLDPFIQKKFKKYLKEYVKKGNTIFLSTHVLAIADEICTHIGILKNGSFIVEGELSKLKKKKMNLEDFFMGAVDHEA